MRSTFLLLLRLGSLYAGAFAADRTFLFSVRIIDTAMRTFHPISPPCSVSEVSFVTLILPYPEGGCTEV